MNDSWVGVTDRYRLITKAMDMVMLTVVVMVKALMVRVGSWLTAMGVFVDVVLFGLRLELWLIRALVVLPLTVLGLC